MRSRELVQAGVHAAPVWDQNRLDEQPQLAARGFTQWLDHPVTGPVPHPGIGAARATVPHRLPRTGADRRAAHHRGAERELGVVDDELVQLAADGVIGGR